MNIFRAAEAKGQECKVWCFLPPNQPIKYLGKSFFTVVPENSSFFLNHKRLQNYGIAAPWCWLERAMISEVVVNAHTFPPSNSITAALYHTARIQRLCIIPITHRQISSPRCATATTRACCVFWLMSRVCAQSYHEKWLVASVCSVHATLRWDTKPLTHTHTHKCGETLKTSATVGFDDKVWLCSGLQGGNEGWASAWRTRKNL